MGRRASEYSNLDGLHSERAAVSWYSRVLAFAASWLIMGGYLILTPTFDIASDDSDSKLRVGRTTLSALGIVLFAVGYVCSGIVVFTCKSLIFQVDSIYTPCLTSSSLGLLTVIYSVVITTHNNFSAITIVSLVAAAFSTAAYALLLLLTWRRVQRVQRVSNRIPTTPDTPCNHTYPDHASSDNITSASTLDGGNSMQLPPWQPPEYYKNYLANMFPSAHHAAERPTAYTAAKPNEEEQQRQQMLALLLKGNGEVQTSPEAGQSTFKIDLNIPDEEPHTAAGGNMPPEWRRMSRQQLQAMARGYQMGREQGRQEGGAGDRNRLGPAVWDRRGRQEERARSQERAVSREERRRQIELGQAVQNSPGAGRPF